MVKRTKHEAAIPNPALKAFNVLVGEWRAVGTHPGLPDTTLHGHTFFAWLEGGAFPPVFSVPLLGTEFVQRPGVSALRSIPHFTFFAVTFYFGSFVRIRKRQMYDEIGSSNYGR
jgi:hypothetical protein